jgi:hypothetical protein
MEHLRLDNQRSPAVSLDPDTQHIYHYVYIRGRCSLVELFPIFARRVDGFLDKLESLLVQGLLHTDLKSIWAREKQVIFTETPLSKPEESDNPILDLLNKQVHVVGQHFDYQHAIYVNRDFQLQWHKMTLHPGDEFYLGHFEDFRGRIYCKGHILTFQGTDFQKSLVRCRPYDLEQSTFIGAQANPDNMSPLDWLMCDVARSYGLDKATWGERLQWTLDHPQLQEGAKEPFLYKSAHEALQKALRGEPIDHLVSLDATASGIQCLALMAQDSQSGYAVNLGTTVVNNPYRTVKEHMGNYDYERVKQAVMTSFYESVATPLELFGENYDQFVRAASSMLPGPWTMKDAIASCMDCRDQYRWTMMDGYEVIMDVTTPVECSMDIGAGHTMTWMEHRKAPVKTKGLTANITHSLDALVLREVLRRTHCEFEWYPEHQLTPFEELRERDIILMQHVLRWQRTQFVSVALLDYCDALNQHLVPVELQNALSARTTVWNMHIQPIHDCYRVRAVDAGLLFQIVKEVMADLAYAKTAEWLLPQIGYVGKVKDNEARRLALKQQVLESSYLIC